ncbi:Outer membrane autotransporter [Pseudomonas savastanoi pv. glycinea]|uniref:Outer membrane autotransporter n=1 Tax=Pseudomonas savastanoi pv. glycinea TaxID=318 RepID=A0ABR5L3V6_PSESG|nr:Outer membrane autotransporter [Pseudomonas savastanoi pv. glycinea]KPC37541.1 Outer membrane autotransporter [Pseudomonas savastanoi pv. glycinea]KPC38833.1 Outer membrane autotransporter [Pseudomonas savastanoi pv. glycinea]KPC51353.1 Outer membrane autotransporter [Pseudomonas savastanoi pv. glycinea]
MQASAAASSDNNGLSLDTEAVTGLWPDEELPDETVREGLK